VAISMRIPTLKGYIFIVHDFYEIPSSSRIMSFESLLGWSISTQALPHVTMSLSKEDDR
jgi:hypothetical protein